MRSQSFHIIGLLVMGCMVYSCNIQKHLPAGTQLYNGATYTITKDKTTKTSTRSIRKQLQAITSPVANKTLLGFPYRVWFWYMVGEPERTTGLRYWLRNRIGQEPVLSTLVNTGTNAANFANYLINKGFFDSKASGDTVIKRYKVKARYRINVGMPYRINNTSWIIDSSSEIGNAIGKIPAKDIYIKKDDQFDLDNLKAERSRIDLALKTKGYYYFSPEYIKAWVDSTNRNHTVNVFFKLKPEIPVAAVVPQTIRSITVFPNYTLLYPPPDTSRQGMIMVDSIYIRDTVKAINTATLTRAVTYRPGSLYNIKTQNRTLNRYINTGIFKFVKNRYEVTGDTLIPRWLDVYYYLTQLPRKSIQAEVGTFTKSNSFTGADASITWKNRNAFKGAEQLAVKLYGAYEMASTDSLKKYRNFRYGGELSLVFPRFVTPFTIKETHTAPPKTRFTIGYELLRRQALYTKNYFRGQYDITWKEAVNKEHTLAPISITYNTTTDFDPDYRALVNQVPALKISNLPELITGSFYNYTYHTLNANAADVLYFNGNFDAAGNIIGLINKASQPYSGKFLSAYYAQFVKLDATLAYNKKLGPYLNWINRIIVGAGFPYGNSLFLPFSRQFIIGGANSLRGFQVRQLGPGRVRASAFQQLYYPQVGGDYKLEMNTEMRFPLFGRLKGAAFIDAGNVWTKDALLYGKDAQLTNKFLNDLAVDAGIGFRLDVTFLLIRLDLGLPLRAPYNPRGQEWMIKDIHPFNSIIYNIAIGYPF